MAPILLFLILCALSPRLAKGFVKFVIIGFGLILTIAFLAGMYAPHH